MTDHPIKFKPALLSHPPINSIPPHLHPRFDPTYAAYQSHYNAGRLATHQVPITEFRKDPNKYTISYGRAIAPEIYRITEQKCAVNGGEILVRIFESGPVDEGKGKRAVYINFHGGGWVFGDLRVDHEFCKRVVGEVGSGKGVDGGVVAFDVDYRLAPENKFPVPVEDCWEAFNWILTQKATEFNLDLTRVAVGGVSAGGHLSAVISHLARDANIPLSLQLLAVPATDMDQFSPTGELKEDCPYESYREMYYTQPLPTERMEYFARHFLGTERGPELYDNWKISPIRAPNFKNLAPALVLTAEMDVLRDEGEAYAKKMNEAGSPAEVIRFKGAPHTFMQMDDILEIGKEYNKACVGALIKAFGGGK